MNNKKAIGIYIHIPFCIKKCNYCDFLSFEADEFMQKAYVEALKKEIDSYASSINRKEYTIQSIFFGGGTPSLLREELLVSILDKVYQSFDINNQTLKKQLEITIECNPKTLNKSKLKEYLSAGINRLSIGLQSANKEELILLGRIHTYEDFLESYNLAREVGFYNINVDLLSSLPNQTINSFWNTLEEVTKLSLEHISVYSLILEEKTPFFYQFKSHELPSEEEERRIYDFTNQYLKKKGYHRYEISNYAKTGYESKHNIGYWSRIEYLGFGLGASSFFCGERYKNESNMEKYIKLAGDYHNLKQEVELITRETAMEEFMFLGLRMKRGISIEKFFNEFKTDIFSIYGGQIEKMKKADCIVEEAGRLYLTKRGTDVSNLVMSEFIQ